MAGRLRVNRIIWIGSAALACVLAYAWFDGGVEPLRTVSAPTTLPQVVR